MKKLIIAIFLGFLFTTVSTYAWPTILEEVIDTRQDPIGIPWELHELGVNPAFPFNFPQDEEITAQDHPTDYIPCPIDFEGQIQLNVEVAITNLTGKAWSDLWYVGDIETTLTNDDGIVNGGLAFKIDKVGVNTPLVFESMKPDSIFEPGETWCFVIQEYTNAFGLPASALSTIGVGFISAGDPISSGSILAIVPEPGTILLLGSGLLGMVVKRRKNK